MKYLNELKNNLQKLSSITHTTPMNVDETTNSTNNTNIEKTFENNFQNNFKLNVKKNKHYQIIWCMFDLVNLNCIFSKINWEDKTIILKDCKEYIFFKFYYFQNWNIKNCVSNEISSEFVNSFDKIKELFYQSEFKRLFSKKTIENSNLTSKDFLILPILTKDNFIYMALINLNLKYSKRLIDKFSIKKNNKNNINKNNKCIHKYTYLLNVIKSIESNKYNSNNNDYITFNMFKGLINEKYNYEITLPNLDNTINLNNLFLLFSSYNEELIVIWKTYNSNFDLELSNILNHKENLLKQDVSANKKNMIKKDTNIKINQLRVENNKIIKKYKKSDKYLNNLMGNLKINKMDKKNKDNEIYLKNIFKKYTGCKYTQYIPNKITFFNDIKNGDSIYGKDFTNFVDTYNDLII